MNGGEVGRVMLKGLERVFSLWLAGWLGVALDLLAFPETFSIGARVHGLVEYAIYRMRRLEALMRFSFHSYPRALHFHIPLQNISSKTPAEREPTIREKSLLHKSVNFINSFHATPYSSQLIP